MDEKTEIQVLEKGFVRLEDHFGTDLTVVNAARVSLGKKKETFGEDDEKLIRYLSNHNHFTPFSQPQIQLHIKMPIFVARQYFKHQIGITRNEISRRYVKSPPEFFLPEVLRSQSPSIKQGSLEEPVLRNKALLSLIEKFYESSNDLYNQLIEENVCAEQARIVLPQATYTEFIETGSLFAYARIWKLRSDLHSQKEIREYASAISMIMSNLFPISWKYLTNKDESQS